MSTAPTRADHWVMQGFRAQQAGDAAGAEHAYRQALQQQPMHADALQLLGLLLGARGDARAAEPLLRRSLQMQPAQPHVWNNLGNLLAEGGRSDEAVAAFDRALALAPTYADAHFNRARVRYAQGRVPEAAASLDAALAHSAQPGIGMLQLQSQIEADCARVDLALRTIECALVLAPDRPSLLHNRATLLQRSHRYAEALHDHERAQALGLDAADAHYNRGNTLQSLGRHDEALDAYRRALALDPVHRLALYDISRLRWRQGVADFDAELLAAQSAVPASAVAPGLRGSLLWRAERPAEAADAFREALRRDPDAAPLHDGLGRCLVRLGQTAAGLAAHARAVALAPGLADLRVNHAASLLVAGEWPQALAEAQAACELSPNDQHALALLGLGWRITGDPRDTWLNDHARFVAVIDLEPPPGRASMADFNAALAVELQGLHGDRAAPVDQTLRQGTQTLGDLFDQGHPLVDALKQRIAQAIDAYVASLPADPAHPFLRRRSGGWRFADSWSSRLGAGGFHTNHVHPHGWISSAYYVQVPPVCADDPGRQGWLQFGQPDIEVDADVSPRLQVEPRVGRLVLFPSMFWHGTVPFQDAARRLTIAFDVQPT